MPQVKYAVGVKKLKCKIIPCHNSANVRKFKNVFYFAGQEIAAHTCIPVMDISKEIKSTLGWPGRRSQLWR